MKKKAKKRKQLITTTSMASSSTCAYTSAADMDDSDNSENEIEWQKVPYTKKKRANSSESIANKNKQAIETASTSSNRFSDLEDNDPEEANIPNSSEPKPPPLFIPNITNIKEMNTYFSSVISPNQYSFKALRDGQIRVTVKSISSYRTLVSNLKIKKISFHTFQTKQDRAYRVVIKNLHHTTNTEDIKAFIEKTGHKVRNISNIKSYFTKQPLSMFFLDLEPNDNNKEIYNLTHINNAIITIEPPRKQKDIPQCHRCQQYGHTRSYCNKPFKCVKCGENHITAECMKNKTTPPKCANCQESHPASYRGCIVHIEYKRKLQQKISTFQQVRQPTSIFTDYNPQNNNPQQSPNLTYSEAIKNNQNSNNNNAILQKIETLLSKQMELTNTLLNMMSVLCTKLCQ